jgi:hypothetical protein
MNGSKWSTKRKVLSAGHHCNVNMCVESIARIERNNTGRQRAMNHLGVMRIMRWSTRAVVPTSIVERARWQRSIHESFLYSMLTR